MEGVFIMRKVFRRFDVLAGVGILVTCVVGCGQNNEDAVKKQDVKATVAVEESNQKEEVVTSSGKASTSQVKIPQYDGYTLLWNDEFSDENLNMDIWNYEPHEPGWTNNELQEYTTSNDNVFLRDGHVVLKALQTKTDTGNYYTSGKITTQKKKDFMYGKVVVSAKVPEGKGLWPAIWMMPTEESYYGQWPKCGEIDIMEVLGNQTDTAYGTIHYGEPHSQQQGTYVLTDGRSFSDSFHEYSVEWEPGEMRFYIDGNLYHTVNDWFTAYPGEEEKTYPAPFNQTFFVQLNLAVGGNWPGDPDEHTDFNKSEFEIDYVRVYQKEWYDTNVKKPDKAFRNALEDGNLIYNGDFAEEEDLLDETNWSFLLFHGGAGSAAIKDGILTITSQEEGTEEYSVQIVQPELPMYQGKNYRLTFDACASSEREMIVCVSAPTAGWIRYLQDTSLTLTTEWKTFTYLFEMTQKTDNNGRLEFNMGKQGSTEEIYIKNVRIEIIE